MATRDVEQRVTDDFLEFDPAEHRYSYGGRVISSVTQVLKHAGLYAGYDFAKQADIERARAVAIQVHDRIDQQFRIIRLKPKIAGGWLVQKYLRQFNQAIELLQIEVVDTELRLIDRLHRCAGTLDILGRQFGLWVLMDVKVMQKVNREALELQTGKYAQMTEQLFDIEISKRFGLQLTPNKFVKHELTDPLAADRFDALLDTYLQTEQAGETT